VQALGMRVLEPGQACSITVTWDIDRV